MVGVLRAGVGLCWCRCCAGVGAVLLLMLCCWPDDQHAGHSLHTASKSPQVPTFPERSPRFLKFPLLASPSQLDQNSYQDQTVVLLWLLRTGSLDDIGVSHALVDAVTRVPFVAFVPRTDRRAWLAAVEDVSRFMFRQLRSDRCPRSSLMMWQHS